MNKQEKCKIHQYKSIRNIINLKQPSYFQNNFCSSEIQMLLCLWSVSYSQTAGHKYYNTKLYSMKLTPMGVIHARRFRITPPAKSICLIMSLKFRELRVFIHNGLSKNKGTLYFPVSGKRIRNLFSGQHCVW